MKLSANLGLLWRELSLPDAVRAAARAGFDAVECHFPFDVPPAEVSAVLRETGLPMLGLNTPKGRPDEFGLAAMPGRQAEARAAIDKAVDYAAAIGCRHVHVMAGATGGGEAAEAVFRANLAHACERAAHHALTIVIEPVNTRDVPDYHLSTIDHAAETLAAVGMANLKIMFDCYHLQIMHGGLKELFRQHRPSIAHVQFAAVPDRNEPDHGEIDYPPLVRAFHEAGYDGYLGAEYRPRGDTDDGLGWMAALKEA